MVGMARKAKPWEAKARAMRHRVILQDPTDTQDGTTGQLVQTWVAINDGRGGQRWAEVMPLSGRELLLAQQVQADVTHRVLLRYDVQVTPKRRFAWGSRVFQISAVLNPGERHAQTMVEALCVELVGQA